MEWSSWCGTQEYGNQGRYVGAEAVEEDGGQLAEKLKRLTATLREQQAEAAKLDVAIAANLKDLGYDKDRMRGKGDEAWHLNSTA